MAALLMGIDIGTSSTKGVLVTEDGTVVALATRAHGVTTPRPGHAEMDADATWWGEVASVSRELLAGRPGSDVAGVCVSGLGPCLVVCDAADRPVRPAILYGIDARATTEIAELTERYGAEAILRTCGKALSSQAVGPKLSWIRRHEPDGWARGRRWFGSSSFVVRRLTGEYVLDHHTASQCDPLYDVRTLDWAADWASEITEHLELPRLVWPHEVVGRVTPAAAEATGLPEGTPVSAGTVDAWAEAHSAGVRSPGDLMLMYGTTMFFVQVLEGLRTHPLLWTTAGVDPGRRTMAAGMSTSGSLTQWVRDLTGAPDYETLVEEARAVAPGSDGLVVLPYFAGERTPVFDPQARGVVAGLTLQHGRGHLFRAAYEGIAYGIRQIVALLDDGAGPVSRLVAVGGGTTGGLWTQVVSDVTGRPQDVPQQTIGASYGDALLAAVGVGLADPATDWSVVSHVVEPDPRAHAVHDELFEAYDSLYASTRTAVHTLAAVQDAAFTTPADLSPRSPA